MAGIANLSEKFEKLSKILECNICLERMNNPKGLQCGHAYCKCCLDSVLQFNPDGSATINCPLRCPRPTLIRKETTTNDLQVPHQFRSLMEMMGIEFAIEGAPDRHFNCAGGNECHREVVHYCLYCSKNLCDPCKGEHNHGRERFTFIPVRVLQAELHPWCVHHEAIATYSCNLCVLACMYCRNRGCQDHMLQDIAQTASDIMKQIKDTTPSYNRDEAKLKLIKNVTEDTFHEIRGKIKGELSNRKIRIIMSCLKKLEGEEERILKRLDQMKDHHFNTYPATSSKDFVEGKPGFDIALNWEKIMSKVSDNTSDNILVPQTSWSLSEFNSNDQIHPLGDVLSQDRPSIPLPAMMITNTLYDYVPINAVKNEDKELVKREIGKILKLDLEPSRKEVPKAVEEPAPVVKEPTKNTSKAPEKPKDDGKQKFKPITTGIQQFRVEKKKRKVRVDIPCYAQTPGEPTFYMREEDYEELIPFETEYGNVQRVRDALVQLDRNALEFLTRLASGKVETIIIELIKIRQKKVLIDQRDRNGLCMMHWMARHGCMKALLYALQYDLAPVDIKAYRTDYTPLHCAIMNNQHGTVELLLAYGADVNMKSTDGSALDYARDTKISKLIKDAHKRDDVW